jgi:zinc transport system substrate-binding protein
MFRVIPFCLVIVCFSLQSSPASATGKLRIVASVYPLAHFVSEVGGEHAEVITLTPGGIDPHEYEPSVRDLMRIWEAGVFVFHGAGIDPWAERVRKDLEAGGILTVHMFRDLNIPVGGDESPTYGQDPHTWLDPLLAHKEVQIIRDALVRADPAHAETYGKNSEAFMERLLLLHGRFEEGLRDCAIRDIIITHDSLSYFAKRYRLKVLPITGISPEEEPSPRRMVRIIRFAIEKKIRYIFTEPLVSSRTAEAIAREAGAATFPFHTFGGLTKDEMDRKRSYVSVMDENLRNLRMALSCR